MPNDFLSDHYGPLNIQQAQPVAKFAVPQSINGAVVRYKRGYASLAGFFSADTVRFLTIRSSDRIHWMAFSSGPLSMSINLGIWQQGENPDGSAVDSALFMSSISILNTAQIEALTAGSVTEEERGIPVWEMLGLSSDPQISYDIVAESAVSTGIGDMLLEAMFTREVS